MYNTKKIEPAQMMNIFAEELQQLDVESFISRLHSTYETRKRIQLQYERYYLFRQFIEFSVKIAISASLLLFLNSGPAALLTFTGMVLLKTSTSIFNRYHPSEEENDSSLVHSAAPLQHIEDITEFRKNWFINSSSYEYYSNFEQLNMLLIRIACSLVIGFIMFALLNTHLDLPLIFSSMLYTYAFTEQASRKPSPFIEDEESLKYFLPPNR